MTRHAREVQSLESLGYIEVVEKPDSAPEVTPRSTPDHEAEAFTLGRRGGHDVRSVLQAADVSLSRWVSGAEDRVSAAIP